MIPRPDHKIEIPTTDEYPVRGDFYVPETASPPGIVVLCHGFKGYKTWGFFPYVAGRIREAGLAALSIDFSFNGTHPTGGSEDDSSAPKLEPGDRQPLYPRPDLFRINTITRERNDLLSVMRFIRAGQLDPHIKTPRSVGLFGHSRGGVVSFLHAVQHNDVDALCTWSIPDHANIFDARQIERWRAMGDYDFTNAADGTRLSVSLRYLDDLENNIDAFDLAKQATRLRTPHLIVHGETDLAVDVECARVLHDAEENLDDKQLLIVRTGHLFGVTYPAQDVTPANKQPHDPGAPADAFAKPAETTGPDAPPQTADAPTDVLVKTTDVTVDWFATHLGKGV
ncbi:MAG: hypothetical protein JSW50_00935 [Candidatus Latescibacterota bacterium]|nr:MAG: hypothetical protein JSW50_00935 [Candidatus Latescibacterota bacterium]